MAHWLFSPQRLSGGFLAAALFGLSTPSSLAGDRRPDPGRLTLATFNARFLFDGREPEGAASFPWKGNPLRARAHLREIAEILRGVDADVLHLSEVEDLATLERLLLEIGDPTYRAFLVPGADEFTRQNVGLLTRVDPVGRPVRSGRQAVGPHGGPPQGVPKHYAVKLDVGDLRLTLVGAHLLAFPDDPERSVRRESQAVVLADLAREAALAAGRLLVLLGDLNDFDPAVPDAAAHVPASDVLAILKEGDPATGEDDLANPAALLPREERFTAFYDADGDGRDGGLRERSLTDHVLLPALLLPRVESVEVHSGGDPFGPSDHFPLKVTLSLARSAPFRRGDLDADGHTSVSDAQMLLDHLFSGRDLVCPWPADADDNGRLDLADAVLLLGAAAGRGDPLPSPGPLLPAPGPVDGPLACQPPGG